MKFRNIAMALTFAAGVAGISNSHAKDPRVTASAGRAVEIDVLNVLINRPLQTPAEQAIAVAAGKGE